MKNGKKPELMSYEELRELLQMTALQTAENAKQLQISRKEHDREMKEIRVELKKLIQRIAV